MFRMPEILCGVALVAVLSACGAETPESDAPAAPAEQAAATPVTGDGAPNSAEAVEPVAPDTAPAATENSEEGVEVAATGSGGFSLEIPSFPSGTTIPDDYAFCVPADSGHVKLGPNKNPHLKWSKVPEGTKSFAVVCHDSDVPSVADDVNQEGKTIAKDLERIDFYHWVMADIAPSVTELKVGMDSDGVTARGKPPGPTDYGARGVNDYTKWFAPDKDMRGEYGGYDGPCPPWNDERLHNYTFTVYALSVDSLEMGGTFDGSQLISAMQGKILDKASWVGSYSLNPKLRSAPAGSSAAAKATTPPAADAPATSP